MADNFTITNVLKVSILFFTTSIKMYLSIISRNLDCEISSENNNIEFALGTFIKLYSMYYG